MATNIRSATNGPDSEHVDVDRAKIDRMASPAEHAPRLPRRGWHAVAALVAYAVLAVLAFLPVLPLDDSRIVARLPSDTIAVGWFLAWPTYALAHAHSVLFTSWIDYPTGVNLAVNQSMPLLGVVMTPVTHLFGPFATINLTLYLGFVVSALAMFIVLRRFCRRDLASFIGGLLYGFSPFAVAHSSVNQDFTFAPLPPLILLAVFELAGDKNPRILRTGSLLGVALAAQLYLNPETTADTVVVACGTAIVCGAVAVRQIGRARALRFLRGCSVAALVAGALSAPFLWYYFAGPQNLGGSVLPVSLGAFHTDVAGLVTPGRNQLFGPTSVGATGNEFMAGMTNEIGTYLGVPLLVGLVWFVARHWRIRVVAASAVTFVVALVLSLGPQLYFDNHALGIPLPDRILDNLPVLDRLESTRYFLLVDLAAAVILAIGLDHVLREWSPREFVTRHLRANRARLAGGLLLAGALLFPLIPRWPYPSEQIGVPGYFTGPSVDRIAEGAVVLTYPYAEPDNVTAEIWQLASGFRFRLAGGYAYVANNGGQSFGNPPIHPATLVELLRGAYVGYFWRPPETEATYRALRAGLHEARIDDFVMTMRGADPGLVRAEMTTALGRRPDAVGGVLVWYDVPRDLARMARTAR
jgi:hypothetical protein